MKVIPLPGRTKARSDHEFAQQLDILRREEGLNTAQIAKALHCDPRSVRRYLRGERRPARSMVSRWEEICHAEPGRLTDIYDHLDRGVPTEGGSCNTDQDERSERDRRHAVTSSALIGPEPKPPRRFRGYLLAAAGLVLLAIALLAVRNWTGDSVTRSPGVVLRVDNRTTSGRHVREDPNRLPLTTRPVPNCGSRGCVVKDSPTWESKQQIDRAVCQQQGERLTNGDDGSKADDDNPLLDDTRLYYGVMLTDGTTGYVAELWIAREQRGGLGLPPCSRVLPRLPRR